MPWIYRDADQHRCAKPDPLPGDARPGDIWRCDEPSCHREWIVRDSQRDGLYFTESSL